MVRSSKSDKKPIEQYDHKGKERCNNPPVGLVTPETDSDSGKKTYAYDPHLDPSLQWAGKAEHTSFEIPTVSLHVHERIDPRTIIEAVRKRNGAQKQMSLFEYSGENPPLREAIEFYKHKHNWSNRMIAGDSLLVMNSLLEKEGMSGKVQMIYIDPPYGIRYDSNFQPFVNRRDVKDGKDEDLTQEPDMIKVKEDMPADESVARSGETLRQGEWRAELLKCGIRGKNGQYIHFSRVEPLAGARWLHADTETMPNTKGADTVKEGAASYAQRAVISFGPEHAPLEQRQVALAIEEAQTLVPKPKIIAFASFQFDPEAAKDIDETNWPGVTLLKVQMNVDLLTDDLKKKRASNESFWFIGQPDVKVEKMKDKDKVKYRVEVLDFDYYNTRTGDIDSGGTGKMAIWMLDTDYDGRNLFPQQVFFPMSGEKDGWSRLAKNLKAEVDEELIEAYRGTISLPFEAGKNRRIAVKIVDDRGIESLKIVEVK
jgi:hypothetical protein